MSKEMDEYILSTKASEGLELSKEMFNDPNAGILKKSCAIGFGLISGLYQHNIATRAKARLAEKAKKLIK
ncbi:MAG: hypothetical protein ACRBDL_03460 [Alphaproteobacteria bacterium]